MSELTDRARRLLADATPGPWLLGDSSHHLSIWVDDDDDTTICRLSDRQHTCADLLLIAATPAMTSELCDAVDAAVSVAKRYRDGWRPASPFNEGNQRLGWRWFKTGWLAVPMTPAEVAVVEQMEAGG